MSKICIRDLVLELEMDEAGLDPAVIAAEALIVVNHALQVYAERATLRLVRPTNPRGKPWGWNVEVDGKRVTPVYR
jgi:hypothetical protein